MVRKDPEELRRCDLIQAVVVWRLSEKTRKILSISRLADMVIKEEGQHVNPLGCAILVSRI